MRLESGPSEDRVRVFRDESQAPPRRESGPSEDRVRP